MTRPRYPILCWLFIPVVAAHNFEEWLTFPTFGESVSALAHKFGIAFDPPPWPILQIGLFLVTLVPMAFVAIASVGRRSPIKDWLVCWSASIYLANVFVPHIPASIVFKGYTPGVLTAVLINLPFCTLLLRKAVRENYLTKPQAVSAIVTGFLSLPLILPLIFKVSKLIADILALA